MSKFKIEIASVPDRNNLVAEIWFGDTLIAEISQEEKKLEIEIYNEKGQKFLLEDYLSAINEAASKLLSN
ncbi:MAG: hypothetical protein J0H55_16650 [Chitinophagaceae bacterium]|nr:hypothetical protein [Chitinophagaceae bacterium]